MTPLSRSDPAPKICSSAPSNSSNEKSGQLFSHRRFDRAEQPNKLHPFIFRRTSKGTARRRATVVGHCIRQRTHNQTALSSIDHDLVFVVDRQSALLHRVEPKCFLLTSIVQLLTECIFWTRPAGTCLSAPIFVRLSHGDERLATCPSTGSSTATTIKSQSSSSLEPTEMPPKR